MAPVRRRRTVLKGGLALLASRFVGRLQGAPDTAEAARIGFAPIEPSSEDAVRVPAGYTARVLTRWGDPIGHAAGQPEFRADASNDGGIIGS
jgi:secreted PhoX family phosphatase